MYTRKEIIRQLWEIGAPRNRVVMLHSAYSRVGEIEGGPEEFLDTLIEYFTAEGGLFCVPTHTWGLIGERDVTLDFSEKYTNLGLLSRLALERSDGIRSENPTHSTVVFGDTGRAFAYIDGEKYAQTPMSPDGCYGRLYTEGGTVMLLGVTHTSNTFLHAVDEMLDVKGRLDESFSEYTVKYMDGREVKRKIYMLDEREGDISLQFDKFSPAFDYHNVQLRGKIGDAPTILCDAAGMKRVVERIYTAADADPLRTEGAIAKELYS